MAESSERRAPSATHQDPKSEAEQVPAYKHRRTGDKVHKCKKAHRTDLKPNNWNKYGYWKKEEALSSALASDPQTVPIPRIHRRDVTPQQFFERFALPKKPCIIEGAIEDWPAMAEWEMDRLLKRMSHAPFKVGEDDKGRKLKMKLKYFVDYMERQTDDSPLYLFETKMEADMLTRTLIDDFSVPDYFPHDFFDLVNPHSKPPFRWWSIGPKRSGTTVHTDPLGTAAWNAVTKGRKRWVCFEPEVPSQIAKGKDVIKKGIEDDEAVMYFDLLLPRIKAAHPEVKVYEGIQGPGDVIYVPGEWKHGVLNLEDTVAVTQNYVGLDNFDSVWLHVRNERKKLAHLWLRNLRKHSPVLHARALELNKRDKFKMRHEFAAGEAPSSSDSSTESSSDSSSDAAADVPRLHLHAVSSESSGLERTPPWLLPDEAVPPGVVVWKAATGLVLGSRVQLPDGRAGTISKRAPDERAWGVNADDGSKHAVVDSELRLLPGGAWSPPPPSPSPTNPDPPSRSPPSGVPRRKRPHGWSAPEEAQAPPVMAM